MGCATCRGESLQSTPRVVENAFCLSHQLHADEFRDFRGACVVFPHLRLDWPLELTNEFRDHALSNPASPCLRRHRPGQLVHAVDVICSHNANGTPTLLHDSQLSGCGLEGFRQPFQMLTLRDGRGLSTGPPGLRIVTPSQQRLSVCESRGTQNKITGRDATHRDAPAMALRTKSLTRPAPFSMAGNRRAPPRAAASRSRSTRSST